MSLRAFTVGFAALVVAIPAAAQERGTMEFGAFGSAATFDNALSLKTGFGGGGRIGMYLDPSWSVEFEDAEMRATRPNGLRDVNVGLLSGRLVKTLGTGSVRFLIGGGAGVSTETNFMHTYGVDALAGVKIRVNDRADLRIDGVWDWLANEDWKSYRSLRAGVSLYRHPRKDVRTVTVTAPGQTITVVDQSSADALRRLRDSLANLPKATPAEVATMQAKVMFAFDKSDLTSEAKSILNEKVLVFRSNPTMAIDIVGYADKFGSDAYNMALGERRANAIKAYIVDQGIDASRVNIDSKGERQPVTDANGIAGQAPNRRAVFRLTIDAGSKP